MLWNTELHRNCRVRWQGTIEKNAITHKHKYKRWNGSGCVCISGWGSGQHWVGRFEIYSKVAVNCAWFQFSIEIVYDGIKNFSTVCAPHRLWANWKKFEQLNSDNRHPCALHTAASLEANMDESALSRIHKYHASNKIWNLLLCGKDESEESFSLSSFVCQRHHHHIRKLFSGNHYVRCQYDRFSKWILCRIVVVSGWSHWTCHESNVHEPNDFQMEK